LEGTADFIPESLPWF